MKPSSSLVRNIFRYLSKSVVLRQKQLGGDDTLNERKALTKARRLGRIGLAGIYTVIFGTFLWMKQNHEQKLAADNIQKLRRAPPTNTSGTALLDTAGENKTDNLRSRYNFINKVVNLCAPAVFYLEIRDPHKKDMETGEAIITSNGSGFIISEDGWALTNAHVVLNKPQSTITAIMRDGKSYRVYVEDIDMNVDLALLKLEALEKLPCLQFAAPGDASIGEWVVALGSPLSLSNSVTVGIVSSVNRPAEELGLKNFSMTYIQTDASITFGNSGGPLVNLDGQVIGINNLRLTSGISFAIPVEYAKKFLESSKNRLKTGKHVGPMGKTLFGITTISITPDVLADLLRDRVNIPTDVQYGLLVWKVVQESPAAQNGIEVGDIITHINGVPVKEISDIYIESHEKDILEFSILHLGERKKIFIDPKQC